MKDTSKVIGQLADGSAELHLRVSGTEGPEARIKLVGKQLRGNSTGQALIVSGTYEGLMPYFTIAAEGNTNMGKEHKTLEILLAEDNPADVRLVIESLRESKVRSNLYVVMDGVEATAFLRRKNKYARVPRPDIILLDLNLPKRNGKEVLAGIKNDPDLKSIPVVILTASNARQDILESYGLHANCYVIKPIDLDRFITVIKSIANFWYTVAKLPAND